MTKTIQTQPTNRLDLTTLTPYNKAWFKEELKALMESERPVYEKSDQIALALGELEEKTRYLTRQIGLMQQLKKRLQESKKTAKESVAELFMEYGIDRLEGAYISSITLQPAKRTLKDRLVIHDPEALMKLGYVKVTLDEEALHEAMKDKEAMEEIAPYVTVESVEEIKPATIRVNARKSVAADVPQAA
jgi:hypothetical protein